MFSLKLESSNQMFTISAPFLDQPQYKDLMILKVRLLSLIRKVKVNY